MEKIATPTGLIKKIFPPKDVSVRKTAIIYMGRRVPLLVLQPVTAPKQKTAGILWIHGGGYMVGMKEMVYMSRSIDLVRKFGVTVVSPGYRLAFTAPYPAALKDCYGALLYLKKHAAVLHVREDQIMVGGESAGGGLAAALCMLARDKGTVKIAYQMPLYPMLDCQDTDSSRNNHGRVWNTRRNHLGWKMYLRKRSGSTASPYASAARQTDYTGLPPAYTFVGDGEPFLDETVNYIENLRQAGIEAEMDIYHSNIHAFDMIYPDLEISHQAIEKFEEHFADALTHFHAPQT